MARPAPFVYVYGIARAEAKLRAPGRPADLAPARFGQPRRLPCGDLAAIVCDLTLPEGTTLDGLLADSRHAEPLLLHHHRMLDALVGADPVLPLRFGVMFTSERSVAAVLNDNRDALRAALDRIDGALEWGLKVYCRRAQLGHRLSGAAPALVQLTEEISGATEGRAFFLRRRLENRLRDEIERAIAQSLTDTADRLRDTVVDMVSCKLQPAEVHGRDADMVFNGACLVPEAREESFFRVIEDMRSAYGPSGFAYEIIGPLPPYNFAEPHLGSDEHAA